MNIHLFGHSICRTSKDAVQRTETFTDILSKKYNNETDTFTLWQSDSISEERILYFLKKTRDIDLVIIFHQPSDAVFVPSMTHDCAVVTENGRFTNSHKYHQGNVNYHKNILEDKRLPNIESRPGTDFQCMFDIYFEYMHTRDLNRNRFNGALMQIDQYLTYTKIPVLHCLYKNGSFSPPLWFSFTSGIVDDTIAELQDRGPFTCGHNESVNRINQQGNIHIANMLSDYITKLVP